MSMASWLKCIAVSKLVSIIPRCVYAVVLFSHSSLFVLFLLVIMRAGYRSDDVAIRCNDIMYIVVDSRVLPYK